MKKNKRIKYFAIYDEIYHKNFHLVVNVSKKRFGKWVNKTPGEKVCLSGANAILIWNRNNSHYVWVEKFDWSIESQGFLVHELSHFADFVLNNAGISIGQKNTEVRAYYFEYIFKKVYTELKSIYGKEVEQKCVSKPNQVF